MAFEQVNHTPSLHLQHPCLSLHIYLSVFSAIPANRFNYLAFEQVNGSRDQQEEVKRKAREYVQRLA